MIPKTEKIWMDGKFVSWDNATVHILTHTLHYGLGVFEGIRCYETREGTAIFRLNEHIDRLFNSAHIFLMDIPYSKVEIRDAIIKTIRVNKIKECYIRPLVYIGYGAMGLYPKENPINVSIAVWSWGSYLGDKGLKDGIRIKTSSFIKNHVNANMARGKVCGYYVNSQLAKKEAISCGYDEALLLDTEGYVSEGSGENIFIVRNGILKTTPLTSILEGITRNSIINIANDEGIKVAEERFTRDELYIADESFFTGTAAEVTPIREADGRAIGNGKPGKITKKLQSIFFDIVRGRNKKYESWLMRV
ncbi:MAG: branched chain amino acid aminotransferase [Nitrospirae bacterium CG_4_10_14_0_8_um_filter_41_23]|nr:branched-chain amino acid transaminase [Nitrospirota bacterium]OIP59272.1 MAG: branched chain amino acid aminotransferase [Nitrospirae bacterium CG2_30_41_42]PIQ94314.1 MAG: branched chain amino acid aminotransferase [Nitrospirae bacterium CG11_big_fil_rev_8_21_14_0_20_41_14]PIV44181.1 MAG: branched chain amino acid aminotransferase [Nitrospirae bacterium CG02_land_8_20_14_3_00_41_53]PIW87308.1 MAG: branched chain amino acid aminotransferase [Nitrospirae bacterium CG_4_8_14_3_um_filter_41_47